MSGSWMVSYPVSTNIWYHCVGNRLGYLVNALPYFCYQSIYPIHFHISTTNLYNQLADLYVTFSQNI